MAVAVDPMMKEKLFYLRNKLVYTVGEENCRFKSQNNEGGVTYEVEKGRLSIRLTAPYSEERIREASAYAKKHGLNSKD